MSADFFPWLSCDTRRTARHFADQLLINVFCSGLRGGSDPELAPLAENGSFIQAGAPGSEEVVPTHALSINSPVLNQGSNPEGLLTDQRGLPGDVNTPDIGSYELQ